jgi:hypothetical protein
MQRSQQQVPAMERLQKTPAIYGYMMAQLGPMLVKYKDHKAQQEHKVLQVHKALKVLMAHKAQPVMTAHKVPPVMTVLKECKA